MTVRRRAGQIYFANLGGNAGHRVLSQLFWDKALFYSLCAFCDKIYIFPEEKKMKKILSVIIAMLMLALAMLFAVSCGSKKVPVIGINQLAQHGSLDNCREGFIEGLKEAGLTEGEDFKIEYQNASGDTSIIKQISDGFSAKNVAMMVGIATNSAVSCFAAAEDKDIPVVFIAVSDPVGAKLTEGNVTGISDLLPVTAQLELIRKMQPDAKKIGIIYTLSEPNSVSTIELYKNSAADYGFELEIVGITEQSQVTQAVDTIIAKGVDCFTNLTDNTVVEVLPAILEKTDEAGIPVYGSEIKQVELGCVGSAGIDYTELGKTAGKMAAKILKGEAKASDMPYETVKDFSYYVNSKAAERFGITIPADIAESAVECGK